MFSKIKDIGKRFGFDSLVDSIKNVFASLRGAIEDNKERILTTFSETFEILKGGVETFGTIVADKFKILFDKTLEFTVNERALLDEFFNGVIDSALNFVDLWNTVVGGIFESVDRFWQEDGKRIWGNIVTMFTDIILIVMNTWNTYIKPVIDSLIAELKRLWEEHLEKLWNNILGLVASIWDFITAFWNAVLKPLIKWVIDYIGPTVVNVSKAIISVVGTIVGTISDSISALIRQLRGILDFLTGVFTGDWKKAWGGLKDVVRGAMDGIWNVIKGSINLIIGGINLLWSGLYSSLRQVVNGVGSVVGALGKAIGKNWSFSLPKSAPVIPKLAEGGYVRANQPQLAMIGDNKTQGEIVSPEGKMFEVMMQALESFFGRLMEMGFTTNGSSESGDICIPIYLDGTLLDEVIVTAQQRRALRSGGV